MNMEMVALLREAFKPEAVEYLEMLNDIDIPLTENSYGRVMQFLTLLPEKEAQAAFIGALVDAGWDETTADQLAGIMGVTL